VCLTRGADFASTDGKVDTKTGVGGHLSPFLSLFWTWFILSSFFLFLSCLEHVSPSSLFFVLHSPCLFLKDTFGERKVTPHMELYFYGMDQ
jgi:hypothetical protein